MMKRPLTKEEIEARFAEINARKPEELTPEEEVALAEAEAINDGTTSSLEDYKQELEDYSGRLLLRIPRSLHKTLKQSAAAEGVSLNQYLVYKLAQVAASQH